MPTPTAISYDRGSDTTEVTIFETYLPLAAREQVVKEVITGLVSVPFPTNMCPNREGEPDLFKRVNSCRAHLKDVLQKLILDPPNPNQPTIVRALDDVYKHLSRREFDIANGMLETLKSSTPPIQAEESESALTRKPIPWCTVMRMLDEETHQYVFRHRPHTLPGYSGPDIPLAFWELLSGGTEFRFRLGLLQAECYMGLQQFEAASKCYSDLLRDLPNLSGSQRKFLAIRSGFAYLAQGDALFRRFRNLADDTQRSQVLTAYNTAAHCLKDNAVSPESPLYQQIDAYAQAQILKVNGGFNFLGYLDSYVPFLGAETLHANAIQRCDDAQEAVDKFEKYLNKATELTMLSDEYQKALEITNKSIEIAGDRKEIASKKIEVANETIGEIDDQIDDLDKSTFKEGAVLGTLIQAAGAATTMCLLGPAGPYGTGATAATAIGSLGGLMNTRVDNEGRKHELQHQKRITELERANAEQELTIAEREVEIETINKNFANDQKEIVDAGRLNPALYYALANVFEDSAVRCVEQAMRWAYLYERAVAFKWLDPDLQSIRFDLLDTKEDPTKQLLAAPGRLKDELKVVKDTDDLNKNAPHQILDENPISLRQRYPVQFSQLKQQGEMHFAISLYDLALPKVRRGVYKQRLKTVDVRVIGLENNPTGFWAKLTHHGSFLVRDKDTTLLDQTKRFVPTSEELEAALAKQGGGGQGHPVGGVIPIVLEQRIKLLSSQTTPDIADSSHDVTLGLFEGYGPAATWSFGISVPDLALITDVLLTFHMYIPQSDDDLEEKVSRLLKDYEEELAAGDRLDRIAAILLREQRPDALKQLKTTGEASFQLREVYEVPSWLTDVKVKAVIMQTIDQDGEGISGITLEVAKKDRTFSITRTIGEEGYSEDLTSTSTPPFVEPAARVPMLGSWQIRLPDPSQASQFNNVLLFFIYEFKRP